MGPPTPAAVRPPPSLVTHLPTDFESVDSRVLNTDLYLGSPIKSRHLREKSSAKSAAYEHMITSCFALRPRYQLGNVFEPISDFPCLGGIVIMSRGLFLFSTSLANFSRRSHISACTHPGEYSGFTRLMNGSSRRLASSRSANSFLASAFLSNSAFSSCVTRTTSCSIRATSSWLLGCSNMPSSLAHDMQFSLSYISKCSSVFRHSRHCAFMLIILAPLRNQQVTIGYPGQSFSTGLYRPYPLVGHVL